MRDPQRTAAQGEGSDALAFVFAGLVAGIVLLPVTGLVDYKLAAFGLALPVLIAGLSKGPRSAWEAPALAAWRWSALAVAAFALVGQWGQRASGSFGNAGYFSAFAVLSWPLFLVPFRPWALALMLASLAATGSRAALLAVAVQAALLLWRRPIQRTQILIWAVIFLGIALLALGSSGFFRPTLRWELWRQTLALGLQKPWMGWGPGSFALLTEGRWSGALAQALVQQNSWAEHPHQLLLSIFFQLGAAGLLIFSWAMGVVYRSQQHARESGHQALFLGFVGLLVHAQFDRYFFHIGLLGPFLLVFAVHFDLRMRRPAWVAAILLGLIVTIIAWRPIYHYRAAIGSGIQALRPAAPMPKLAAGPQDPAHWDQQGTALAAQGVFHEAAGAFREAQRLQPTSGRAQNLGNSLFAQGLFKEAEAAYRDAVRLDPRSADAHFSLGYALFRQNRIRDAVASLDAALKLQPGHVEAATLKRQILR